MILDLGSATIRQICSLAALIETEAQEKMIHLEIGNPGLPAEEIGVKAEISALEAGVANKYPPIQGIPELKKAGSKFVRAFLDIDIPEKCIIPTVGSMQGSFTLQLLLSQRLKEKDTMLFLNPGFPANISQAKVLGIKTESFDIYNFRGEALEAKLEEYLSKGNITGLLYSNPNNPAWTNLTEQELEIIGRLATKYDCIVLEDLAYFGMDFRKDISHPNQPPFGVTVAKYTDNYILMLSGSKIFSYAGQRIALVCMSEKVFERQYEFYEKFYEMPALGDAYVFGVLYCASSGTSHSAQHGLAAMLDAAAEGTLNFIDHCSEYGRRAEIVKNLFKENGFHIVYNMDGDEEIADGFFFTIGYPGFSGNELQQELMKYGISSISLQSTGSEQAGIRACVSLISNDEDFHRLEKFLRKFNEDHKK
ncbi:MAG: pyridoxal phosphate-dependent aminotransferase [Bacteroidales bacterium]|nr:pyridoxal phosphate-dependent aminotransferase [Bacteroidales bacterium]MBD5223846.1 pyridoxal phosphate-dependent aminotransferase [Bacteroidales bacterium]MBD5302254.1 pyridoxal phosphate-dependent aminotransferase [Bacteroides sp.]MBD5348585.1 pyridoxal phosphate-dependent aminotransferase [Bacteroides sp.]